MARPNGPARIPSLGGTRALPQGATEAAEPGQTRTPRRWALLAGVTCIMLAARTSDLFITRVFDRALEREQNVLHVHYGAGWSELIAVNLAVVLAAALLFAHAAWHPRRLPPGLDFPRFVGFLYWSRPVPWREVLRAPFQPGWSWCVGRAAPWIVVGTSLLVNAGNLLGHTAWGQVAWHRLVGSTPALLLTLFGMVVACVLAWHKAEHVLYRLASRPAPPAPRPPTPSPGGALPAAASRPRRAPEPKPSRRRHART